ncbi:Uu.00g042220.m01.CDS01 [Anthostomella pinea]|uniref:Uu.00g042220.m01.CDS01 n=1 Tax=Anthostomella pinea TaxID=933095 RepID=A0AAI8VAE8_9PEZI|nr:Uu.00g042220.m01.CDS01 [Anthostomella pinea]
MDLDMPELANYCMRTIFANRGNPRRKKLLDFMEDHIRRRGPLTPEAMNLCFLGSESFKEDSVNAILGSEDFTMWIFGLGDFQHGDRQAVLPTHFSQQHKYLVPAPERRIVDRTLPVTEGNVDSASEAPRLLPEARQVVVTGDNGSVVDLVFEQAA